MECPLECQKCVYKGDVWKCHVRSYNISHEQPPEAYSCNVKHCDYCYDTKTCTLCEYGYDLIGVQCYLSGLSCKIIGCIRCYNYKCEDCEYPFSPSFDGYSCIPYVSDVSNCVAFDTHCTQCSFSYLLTDDYYCTKQNCLLPNCISCEDSYACVYCARDYFTDIFGNCILSQCGISGCALCDYNKKCVLCRSGYELYNNGCYESAGPTIPNCLLQYADQCMVCNNGVIPTSENGYYCKLLCTINNCKKCKKVYLTSYKYVYTSEQIGREGTVAKSNVYLAYSGPLLDNPGNTSLIEPLSKLACIECNSDYYLNYDECHSIALQCSYFMEHCLDCLDNNVCIKCKDGYIFDPINIKCSLISEYCGYNSDNCIDCTSLAVCVACLNNYALKTTQNGTHCVRSCGDQAIYFLPDKATYRCVTCLTAANCEYCDANGVVCIKCRDGYKSYNCNKHYDSSMNLKYIMIVILAVYAIFLLLYLLSKRKIQINSAKPQKELE